VIGEPKGGREGGNAIEKVIMVGEKEKEGWRRERFACAVLLLGQEAQGVKALY